MKLSANDSIFCEKSKNKSERQLYAAIVIQNLYVILSLAKEVDISD